MKCVHCDHVTKYPARSANGGQCEKCKHRFGFEPKTDQYKIGDPFFDRAIQNVSSENTVFFTPRQLWYEVERRLRRRRLNDAGGVFYGMAVVAAITSGFIALGSSSVIPFLVGLGAAALLVGAGVAVSSISKRRTPRPEMTYPTFRDSYQRTWERAHGVIEKMVPPNGEQALQAHEIDPDTTSCSFDRALATDNAEIAAMLVANNFHFENNCAVLSVDGYPFGIKDTVMTMLRRNPDLQVFALHDASAEGSALPLTLRNEEWFPDTNVKVLDLGLSPRHAKAMRLFTISGTEQYPPPEVQEVLTEVELAWLQKGLVAEVAVLRPARLIRAIYQGFGRGAELDTSQGGQEYAMSGGYYPIYFGDDDSFG